MKVLQVNLVCGEGSTGRIVRNIADLLKSYGHEAYVAYGSGTTDFLPSYRITSDMEYRINARIFAKAGFEGRGTRYGTRRLLRWIDSIAPDVVHLHNIHSLCLNYPMLFTYLKKKKIPVVWTLHDCWAMTGGCAHFSSVGCEKWKAQCRNCDYYGTYHTKTYISTESSTYNLKKKLFNSIENLTIVSVSNWLGSIVGMSYLKDKPRIVIQNGINLDVFTPVQQFTSSKVLELKSSTRPIILGVSSIWNAAKGLHEMIALSKNSNYQVVLVGVQNELHLPPEIIAVSRTANQRELAEYYSVADVFVNPTMNDSFPTVNIEAIACGTPVVTYETDGSPEIIDQRTGLVARKGDYEHLASCVSEIICNGKSHYSESCIERAKTLFNRDDRYRDYIDLYNNITK